MFDDLMNSVKMAFPIQKKKPIVSLNAVVGFEWS